MCTVHVLSYTLRSDQVVKPAGSVNSSVNSSVIRPGHQAISDVKFYSIPDATCCTVIYHKYHLRETTYNYICEPANRLTL